MSTDRQRLSRAIQRIAVQAPELRSFLDDAESKGGKPKSAGAGVSDAERERICCDGSTSESANPGTEEREVGGSQSGLDSSDPADIGGGDGTLSGVSDCATGQPVCFDGDGFIPPDGWDAPDDPPIDPDWEVDESLYWEPSLEATEFPDKTRTKGQAKAILEEGSFQGRSYFCGFTIDSETVVLARYAFNSSGCGSIDSRSFSYKQISCDEDANTDNTWCYTDKGNPAPSEIPGQEWPSDGCTNLAIKRGRIVGSKYDPENDGSYSAPRDSIDLCSGGDQISLAPAANGGWKTINSTTNNGYLYDSSGQQIAHIDGNEYSDPSV